VRMSTTLPIRLDRTSQEPLYRQIEAFVRRAIDGGRLRPGQRLPSVRALAGQLGVGRLTVATAYEELAAQGYLVGRMGFGTIVAAHPPEPATAAAVPARPQVSTGLGDGPARLPSFRLPVAGMTHAGIAGAGDAPPRRLGPMPRFDLRAGGSGGTGTAGGPGLSVGPALERLLREEWRELADSASASPAIDPAGDPLLRAAIASHLRTARGA
jgi:DNA-binding transcriptional regulator YhcF (GntR family)